MSKRHLRRKTFALYRNPTTECEEITTTTATKHSNTAEARGCFIVRRPCYLSKDSLYKIHVRDMVTRDSLWLVACLFRYVCGRFIIVLHGNKHCHNLRLKGNLTDTPKFWFWFEKPLEVEIGIVFGKFQNPSYVNDFNSTSDMKLYQWHIMLKQVILTVMMSSVTSQQEVQCRLHSCLGGGGSESKF